MLGPHCFLRRLSVLVASGAPPLPCAGRAPPWGRVSYGLQVLEHGLSSCGPHLVAPRYVESSRARDQTCVPCIGRYILNHWTAREVPESYYKLESLKVGARYVFFKFPKYLHYAGKLENQL